MLKITGVLLVLGAFAGIGISQRQRLLERVHRLTELIGALDYMAGELAFCLGGIPDMIAALSRDSHPAVAELFSAMDEELRREDGLSLAYKWMKVFRARGPELGLTAEDIGIFCDLSEFLGRYDADSQLQSISRARQRLERQLEAARLDAKNKGNVYRTCYIAAGILLVLILI